VRWWFFEFDVDVDEDCVCFGGWFELSGLEGVLMRWITDRVGRLRTILVYIHEYTSTAYLHNVLLKMLQHRLPTSLPTYPSQRRHRYTPSTTQTQITPPSSSRSVRPLTPQAYCSSTALSPLRTRAVRSSMRESHRHTVIEFPQRSSRAATPHAFCFCSRFCFYFVPLIRNRDIGTAETQLDGA